MAAWASTIAKDAATLADAASALARDIGALTGEAPRGLVPAAPGAADGLVPAAAPQPAPPVPAAPLPVAAALAPVAAAPVPVAAEGTPDQGSPTAAPKATAARRAGAGDPGPTPADPCNPDEPAGYATSAAAQFGWGKPNRVEDFNGSLDKSWGLYDGPGHAGNGKRTPDAVSINDGVMTITGDSKGDTEGMAWGKGQKYGRWEGRIKAPASDKSYNALLLLWPDAENWPVGGEVDFMEMSDHTRQSTNLFLHYGKDNSQLQGTVKIDATQWHNWAVEWSPTHITAFVDGKQWWTTSNTSALPPGPMHLCIQLDWFPRGGSVQTSQMDVDWVRQYAITGDTEDRADRVDPNRTDRADRADGADGTSRGGSARAADATPRAAAATNAAPPSVAPTDTKPGLVPAAVASP